MNDKKTKIKLMDELHYSGTGINYFKASQDYKQNFWATFQKLFTAGSYCHFLEVLAISGEKTTLGIFLPEGKE